MNNRSLGCMNKNLRKDQWKEFIYLIHHWNFLKVPKKPDVHLNLVFNLESSTFETNIAYD